MDLYSPALALAFVAVGAAVLAALCARFAAGSAKSELDPRLARVAKTGSLAGLLLAAFSVLYHLPAGHRPGTPEAMGAIEFVLEHPAFMVVVGIAAVVLGWLRREGGRPDRGGPPGAPPRP